MTGTRECLQYLEGLEAILPDTLHYQIEGIREHILFQHNQILDAKGQLGPRLYGDEEAFI